MLVSAYTCQLGKLVSTYFLRQKIVGNVGHQQKPAGILCAGPFSWGPFFVIFLYTKLWITFFLSKSYVGNVGNVGNRFLIAAVRVHGRQFLTVLPF